MHVPLTGKTLSVASRRVHYLEYGSGQRTIVLLHGFASLAQEIAAAFSCVEGSAILAFDRPGYGFSESLPSPVLGPAAQARWLAETLDQLRRSDCIVVAHSLAAGPALWLAARRPELVSSLLLLAPFCRPTPRWDAMLLHAAAHPVLESVLRGRALTSMAHIIGPRFLKAALLPNDVPAHLMGFPFAHVCTPATLRTMSGEFRGFQSDMADFDQRSRLRSKIRVVFGSEDRIAIPDWHLSWLEGLRADIDLHLLPDIGHAPHHVRPDFISQQLGQLAAQIPQV